MQGLAAGHTERTVRAERGSPAKGDASKEHKADPSVQSGGASRPSRNRLETTPRPPRDDAATSPDHLLSDARPGAAQSGEESADLLVAARRGVTPSGACPPIPPDSMLSSTSPCGAGSACSPTVQRLRR